MKVGSDAYNRLLRFHYRWKAPIQMALGAVWTASAILITVIAFNVWAIEEGRNQDHAKERAQVRVSCERSRVFGPTFLAFLEGAESKLQLGALSRKVVIGGKRTSVLTFFRETIPRSCEGETKRPRAAGHSGA